MPGPARSPPVRRRCAPAPASHHAMRTRVWSGRWASIVCRGHSTRPCASARWRQHARARQSARASAVTAGRSCRPPSRPRCPCPAGARCRRGSARGFRMARQQAVEQRAGPVAGRWCTTSPAGLIEHQHLLVRTARRHRLRREGQGVGASRPGAAAGRAARLATDAGARPPHAASIRRCRWLRENSGASAASVPSTRSPAVPCGAACPGFDGGPVGRRHRHRRLPAGQFRASRAPIIAGLSSAGLPRLAMTFRLAASRGAVVPRSAVAAVVQDAGGPPEGRIRRQGRENCCRRQAEDRVGSYERAIKALSASRAWKAGDRSWRSRRSLDPPTRLEERATNARRR